MHVLIVGAGLGGLSLAQQLRKQGISYEIFERDSSPTARFQGWAIAVHSIVNDLQAAFPDDVPGLKVSTDHLQPLNLPAQIGLYYPGREGKFGVQSTPEFPIIRSERFRLREWLSTNIPIQWGKHIRKVDDDDAGVTVYFEDGTSAKGDILVGADGINSIVREHILQRPASDVLKLVPLAAIIGEVDLSGDAFKHQLELGHSAYMFASPDLGFWAFGGLHHAYPDGVSGRHYWMLMKPDPKVGDADHWLQTATKQEKRDYVMEHVAKIPPKFREIFEKTPVENIRQEPHIWRDLELDHIPAGRIILVGDAAHAMTPFRGEGGYHTFIDTLKLSKILNGLDVKDINAVKTAVSAYHEEILERGGEAVRNSRNEQANRKAKDDKSKFVSARQEAQQLPQIDIVLKRIEPHMA